MKDETSLPPKAPHSARLAIEPLRLTGDLKRELFSLDEGTLTAILIQAAEIAHEKIEEAKTANEANGRKNSPAPVVSRQDCIQTALNDLRSGKSLKGAVGYLVSGTKLTPPKESEKESPVLAGAGAGPARG